MKKNEIVLLIVYHSYCTSCDFLNKVSIDFESNEEKTKHISNCCTLYGIFTNFESNQQEKNHVINSLLQLLHFNTNILFKKSMILN